MKKFTFLLSVLVLTTLFATTAMAADRKEVSNKTAIFLLDKSNEAMAGLHSFKMDGTMDMVMTVNDGEIEDSQGVSMDITALAEIPGRMYANYSMETEFGMFESLEIYIDESGVYSKIPGYTDNWEIMIDDDASMMSMLSQMIASGNFAAGGEAMNTGANFPEGLSSKLYYTKNILLDGKWYYVVTLDATLAEYIAASEDVLHEYFAAMGEDYEEYSDELMAQLDLILTMIDADIVIDLYIDKADFNLYGMKLNMDMFMDLTAMYAGTMELDLDYELFYSEYNSAALPFPEINAE